MLSIITPNKIMNVKEGRNVTTRVSVDAALEIVGKFELYQKTVIAVVFLTFFNSAFYLFCIPMFQIFPEITGCSEGICVDAVEACNTTYKYSSLYFNYLTELDLVCSDYQAALIPACIALGFILGSLVWGFIGDGWGRIPTMWVSNCGYILCLVILVVWFNFPMLLICTVAIGVFCCGFEIVSFSFTYDSLHSSYYLNATTFLNFIWGFAQIFIGIIMATGISWRVMIYIGSLFSLLLMALSRHVVESPRYLFHKRKIFNAIENLHHIATINRRTFPTSVVLWESDEDEDEPIGIFEALNQRKILYRLLLIGIINLTNAFIYYGIAFNLKRFGGNVYVNSIFNGVFEILGYIIASSVSRLCPKRVCLSSSYFIIAASMVIQILFIDQALVSSICMYCAKLANAGSYNMTNCFFPELFPTSIFSTVISIMIFSARIGSITASFLGVTPVIFLMFCVVLVMLSFFLSLILPEKSHQSLLR